MKKSAVKEYDVEIKYNNKIEKGKLQLEENEIVVETDEAIIEITYSDINKRSFSSKKGLELKTTDYDFCINGKEIAEINEKVKSELKEENDINKEETKNITISDDEILQEVLKRFNEFNEKYSSIFILNHEFKGLYDQQLDKDDYEGVISLIKMVTQQFYLSMLVYIYNNVDNSEKTIEFFKNLYPTLVCKELLESKELITKGSLDKYPEFLSDIMSLCIRMKSHRSAELKNKEQIDETLYDLYDEFEPYMLFLEESYNNYVNHENKLNIMLDHKANDIDQNKKDAFKYTFFAYYTPIILIAIMIFMFLVEICGDGGIITSGGWFSVFIFIVLLVWIGIGHDSKRLTCKYCGKFDSLKLTSDEIIESRDTWSTQTVYDSNNRPYQKQVAVRIDTHERHYTCSNCHNEIIRIEDEEHKL